MLTLGLIREESTLTPEDLLRLGKTARLQLADSRTQANALSKTRILPIFLLSLKGAPPGLSMKDGSFVAASDGLIIVLQVGCADGLYLHARGEIVRFPMGAASHAA